MDNLAAKVMLDQKAKLVNALSLFRPTEQQEAFVRQFAKDGGLEFLVGGGQRSGKTVVTACCIAALCLNEPITFLDGTKIHLRPERWRSEGLKLWLVGYDHKHIGKTLHRVLLRPNLFRVIRDQKTGRWRTWNPLLAEDKDSFNLTRPSPPLIRESQIVGGKEGISWENKKERQVSSFELLDGTRLEFFASTGAMPTGDPAHVIWCDERLEDDAWISELLMRLADHRGRFVWTSWPGVVPSSALSELEERAATQLGKPNAKSFCFLFNGDENPYTDSEHRDAILATMDEDTKKARGQGVLNTDRWRVYPRYSRYIHRVLGPDPEGDDKLAKAVRKINGIPPDWTRYLILDPGTANPAVLFVAVPPPDLGDFIVPYDELYPHYSDAEKIATLIAAKTRGQIFEDFIADSHASRQTPMGFSGTIGQNYSNAFRKENLRCRRQGSNFSYGSDDVATRIQVLQSTMTIRTDGTPKLRILGCPLLSRQIEQYKWGIDPKKNPTDKPAPYQKIDLVNCAEYLVSRSDCGYVKPPMSTKEDFRSPAAIMLSVAKQMGLDKPKPKGESVYCGAGAPSVY